MAFFIIVNSTTIFAQNPQLKFRHINSQQGLSNSTIEVIYQDYRGFIWFGTRDGLNRYDGYQITVFKNSPADSNSISDNYIRCIYEDAGHNLWVGTSNGLNRFDAYKNKFSQYKHGSNPAGLSNNNVNCIYSDKQGTLWIGTADGCLNRFDAQTNTYKHFYYQQPDKGNAENLQVNYLFEDSKSNFWLGTKKGLKLFNRNTYQFISPTTVFKQLTKELDYPVNTIQEDKAGNLWLGIENNGLMELSVKNGDIKRYTHQLQSAGSLSNDQVKSLLSDRKGNIWAGSINGGLNLFNPLTASFKHYQNEPENVSSLSQRTVSALFMDNQNNLWVGTHRGGVNLYSPRASKFRLFQNESYDKNSLSYNDVRAFYEDNQQNIWIGTDGGGLNVYNPAKNSFINYRYNSSNNNSLGSDAVLDILKDNDNKVWISTWGGGLNYLDERTGNFKRYVNNPADQTSISSNYVQKSFMDSEGNFWVATYYGGLNLFNPQTGKFNRFINAPDNQTRLQGNNIVTIGEDKHKNLWIGTDDGGLNCYNLITKKFKHYFNNQEKLPDLRIIFTDHAGNVWLGQAGLYLFKPRENKFSIFTTKAGLGSEYIKGIEEDIKGNLWISGSNGLTKLNPLTLQTVKYNTADGLQGQEFEANSSLKTSNGIMYFGGINGFNQFNPLSIEANQFVPPVYLTGFQIFNKMVQPDTTGSPLSNDISLTRTLDLNYKQSTIALYFSALNYTSPENNKYAYKLEGLDDNWYYAGTERKAAYTNLSPGTYTFRVRATNNDGVWNQVGNSLIINIKPPIWATWWFRTLMVIGFLLSCYLLLRFKKNQDLHKIEERKREELHQLKLQFFTNISHEFRTPLSLILGPLENLLKDSNAISRHYYEMMYRNANRLLHLINELMDFRKVETGALTLKVASGNLNSFVEELAEEFCEPALQKNISLKVITEAQLPNVWFDRQVVEKILLNLINNSLKYTAVNGCVTIELFTDFQSFKSAFDNELVLKNSYRASQYAYICISDNGIGISKESIEHLFERYYRITESHLGSGIGLAFVKSLTVMHKGDIYVYSERHKGTDIIIALPVNKSDYQACEMRVDTTEEGGVRLESIHIPAPELYPAGNTYPLQPTTNNIKKHHILIVDDNDEIRAFIKNSLEDLFNISEATDGHEGISKAKETLPDLIISDVMMPGMDGIAFCKLIKEDIETSHIPFIMLTAKTNLDAEIEGVSSGADLYLSKPLSINLLILSIRNIFEQRQKLKDRYLKNHYVAAHELVHSTKDKEFMDKLLHIISTELSNPDLDIDDICDKIGMSRTKLYHKIKELSGQAPNEFIRSIRLKKAIEIMTHEDVLLTEVIYRVGIQTQSYFTKAFKKEYGKTPTQFLQGIAQTSE